MIALIITAIVCALVSFLIIGGLTVGNRVGASHAPDETERDYSDRYKQKVSNQVPRNRYCGFGRMTNDQAFFSPTRSQRVKNKINERRYS